MVEAARRYGRVVSGGSQRVLEDYKEVVNKCWGGELGTIKSINVNVGPISQPCNLPAQPVPPDIDWEMWLGPRPGRRITRAAAMATSTSLGTAGAPTTTIPAAA